MVDLNTELNFYEDDGDRQPPGPNGAFVIGISLGATRKFQLTPFKGAMPVGATTDFTLHSGDCYIMDTVARQCMHTRGTPPLQSTPLQALRGEATGNS